MIADTGDFTVKDRDSNLKLYRDIGDK